jgi:hypothetical protein
LASTACGTLYKAVLILERFFVKHQRTSREMIYLSAEFCA